MEMERGEERRGGGGAREGEICYVHKIDLSCLCTRRRIDEREYITYNKTVYFYVLGGKGGDGIHYT